MTAASSHRSHRSHRSRCCCCESPLASPVLSLLLLLLLLLPLPGLAANCSDAGSSCVTGSCVAATGKCTCPADSLIAGERCDSLQLYPTTGATTLTNTATSLLVSKEVKFDKAPWNYGVPLGNSETATRLFVCSNGYVTFHSDFCTTRVDLLAQAAAPSHVAMLASSFDFRNDGSGKVSYQMVDSVDADKKLKWLKGSLTDLAGATAALIVTWESVSPPVAKDTKATRSATLQLLLFTDFNKETVAVMFYKEVKLPGYFVWLPTRISWQTVEAGRKILAADRQASVTLATTKTAVGGVQAAVQVEKIFSNSTATNYRRQCLEEEAQKEPAPSATVQQWCPQTLPQAQRDIRFRQVGAGGSKLTFNMIPSLLPNATSISCVYDAASGAYLLRDSSSSIYNFSRANFHDFCCVREPNLCNRYYAVFKRPNSKLYLFPNKAGFVSGAGQFRSFDSQLYRYMAVGDFWLLNTDKLKVQVRMQDTNSALNNTAAVTGVAVKFEASANMTVEVHWNSASKKLASIHYDINNGGLENFTEPTTGEVNKQKALLTAAETSMNCYTLGNTAWLEVSAGSNGLAVSVYVDSTFFNITSGLLGNNDGDAKNDVRKLTNEVLPEADLNKQASVSEYLATWSVKSADSLFKVQATVPTAESSWSPQYWDAAWSNETLLTEKLFGSNATVFGQANSACSSKPKASPEYQSCLMEIADCSSAACGTAYLNLLASTQESVQQLTCQAPKWKATTGDAIQVTEGTKFTLDLATMTDHPAAKSSFSKYSGPANLTVDGSSLTWTPSQSDLAAIAIALRDTDTNCSSLWTVSVRFTRTQGACQNSDENFGYLSQQEVYAADDILKSMCSCKANYYTASCSFATCQLDCHSCNSTSPTSCLDTCPSNYNSNSAASLKVCWYKDNCEASSCASATTTGCRSLSPEQQTASVKFQCTCKPGFQYKLKDGATDKTVCEDQDECKNSVLNTCNSKQTCKNTVGSFACECKSGYKKQGEQCVDVDECVATPTLCSRKDNANVCTNIQGSYECRCGAGFVQTDARTCTDADECANPDLNQCKQTCTNTEGNFTCGCFDGFEMKDGSCAVKAGSGCAATAGCSHLCAKVSGKDTCYCRNGFQLQADNKNCAPKKFCSSSTCGGGSCTEANPGFTCKCNNHFQKANDGTCVKIDYCGNSDKRKTICPSGVGLSVCSVHATTNVPTCACKDGYQTDGSNACVDVNECENATLHNCDSGSTICQNRVPGFRCACKPGYKRINATLCQPAHYTYNVDARFTQYTFNPDMANIKSPQFADIVHVIEEDMPKKLPNDGSSLPTVTVGQVSNGSVIANTSVSYNSPSVSVSAIKQSLEGAGVGSVTVTLVDECAGTHDCSVEHNCVNTVAGYTCQCKSGYTKIGIRGGFPSTKIIEDCVDNNECLTMCKGANKICVNVPGNYSCSCANGTYSESPRTKPCEDPCVAGRCKNDGVCQYQRTQKFPYRCVCVAGYTGFHCELEDQHYWTMRRNIIIVGAVLGALLLLALIVILVFLFRKRRNEGTYKGTQAVPMSDTSIPRAQPASQHPSSYENRGYEREQQQRSRTDYF